VLIKGISGHWFLGKNKGGCEILQGDKNFPDQNFTTNKGDSMIKVVGL
jgi:hypothetical protein